MVGWSKATTLFPFSCVELTHYRKYLFTRHPEALKLYALIYLSAFQLLLGRYHQQSHNVHNRTRTRHHIMGLFATLAASAGGPAAVGADGSGKSDDNSSSSSTSLPTAVQLHTSHRIDFLSGGIDGRRRGPTSSAANSSGNSTTAKRRFETLSYQAVEVTAQQDGEGRSGGILQQQQANSSKAKKHQRPNLGIWDVRLPDTSGETDGDNSTDLINRLLQKVISPPSQGVGAPTVIFALDLADPSAVHPAMEGMVAALLRRYDAMGADGASAKISASASATTRLSKLRSTKFGAAPEQSEEVPSNASGGGSADTRIALIICCAVPPTPAEVGPEGGATGAPQSFQEKQAVSLVHYHLHRFAAEVDCTLAFVRPDDDGANPAASAPIGNEGGEGDNASAIAKSKGAIPSLTVTELAAVVSRVAQGMTPVEEEEKTNDDNDEVGAGDDAEEAQEGGAATAAGSEQPPIFVPGTHDDDLIGSVLLRNASCPGVWDAAKDDLWKALPSAKAGGDGGQKASDKKRDVKVGGAAADEAWLSKLAASLPAQGATGAGDDVSVKTSKSSKSSSAIASGSSSTKVSTKKKRVTRSTAAKADTKNDDPTSFFENLMKK